MSNSADLGQEKIQITGISCSSCIQKVGAVLIDNPAIESHVIHDDHTASINTIQPIDINLLNNALGKIGNYTVESITSDTSSDLEHVLDKGKSSYWPLALIFVLLLTTTLAIEFGTGMFLMETWMPNFMAGFFLTFSFFKLLNIKDFASNFKQYDLPSKWVPGYAIIYPFIELALGFAYLLYSDSSITHFAAGIIMFVGLLGVVPAVLSKKKIKCACLGATFKLPMSSVTIVENTLMLLMAAYMFYKTTI